MSFEVVEVDENNQPNATAGKNDLSSMLRKGECPRTAIKTKLEWLVVMVYA